MRCKKTLTRSNQDDNNEIPGYIQGSLINILEYDQYLLSEPGLVLARHYKEIMDKLNETVKRQAKELDDLFDKE